MRLFSDMTPAQIKKLMTGMVMAIDEECRTAGVERPKFALFILNDPEQDYCASSNGGDAAFGRDDVIDEVISACLRTKAGVVSHESEIVSKRQSSPEDN